MKSQFTLCCASPGRLPGDPLTLSWKPGMVPVLLESHGEAGWGVGMGIYSSTWIEGVWSSLHPGALQRAGSARVVNVSSFRQAHGYIDEEHLIGAGGPLTFNQNYDCSKLLLASFTGKLAQRLQGTGNCLWHPLLLHSQHYLPTLPISFQYILAI